MPFTAFFGFESKDITRGANRAVVTTKAPTEADVKVVEHTGAAIASGERDLDGLEKRMAQCGYELLIARPGSPTATGAAIDSAKAMTPLQMMAAALKDALELAFELMNRFRGQPAGTAGSITVNTDYGLSLLGGADLTFLLNAVNTGQISRETFLRECMRRDVLAELDVDEEIGRIEAEMPEPVVEPFGDTDDEDDPDEEDGEGDDG